MKFLLLLLISTLALVSSLEVRSGRVSSKVTLRNADDLLKLKIMPGIPSLEEISERKNFLSANIPPALEEAIQAMQSSSISSSSSSFSEKDASTGRIILNFSNSFGDDMVLQRNTPLVFWGFVSGGCASTVCNITLTTSSGDQGQTTASLNDKNGFWRVILPSRNESTVGMTVTAVATSGSQSAKVTLKRVLVGDVFLCGGQSNMQFGVKNELNASTEISNAANYPNIRLFTVGQGNVSLTPLSMFASIHQPWTPASPQSVGSEGWGDFSATCWEFGRQLADSKPNLPIGLISSNWGGTVIQAWSRPNALAQCPLSQPIPGQKAPNLPSVLWNAMLSPLAHTNFAAMLWWQGENNVYSPSDYECQFPAFIKDIRAAFAQSLPFLFVQLHSYTGPDRDSLAIMRLVQVSSTASLPQIGYAVTADLGDPTSPYGDIHNRDKITVGKRLLLAAENVVYGNHHHSYKGPHPVVLNRNGTGFVIGFASASMFPNIDLRAPHYHCGVPPVKLEDCRGFEADVGGFWSPCSPPVALPSMGSAYFFVDCQIPTVKPIAQIRYGYSNWALMYLFNRAAVSSTGVDGLPAEPFVMTMQA